MKNSDQRYPIQIVGAQYEGEANTASERFSSEKHLKKDSLEYLLLNELALSADQPSPLEDANHSPTPSSDVEPGQDILGELRAHISQLEELQRRLSFMSSEIKGLLK